MEKHTIMVVDDEKTCREGLAQIIGKMGYNTVAAKGAEEAISIMEKEPVHIVITDMKMPGMDGIELLKVIKSCWSNTGVIILTAYGEAKSYLEAKDAGVFEYLNKPLRIHELGVIIKRLLAQAENGGN